MPDYALTAASAYTINVTTDVTDLAGNVLDQDTVTTGNQSLQQTFTTGSTDGTSPTVVAAQCNDFCGEYDVSESMLAVEANDINYTSSVLN